MIKRILMGLGLFFLMCPPVFSAEDRVVARIGEQTITASQFERILKLYDAERSRQMKRNPQFKRMILEKYVEGIVLSKKAKEKGLDALHEVKDRIEISSNQILSQTYLQKEIAEKVIVSEDQMRRYYDAHKTEFTRPEQASLRQIFLRVEPSASAAEKEKVRERADEIRKKLEKGEDFAKLAAEFSEDPEAKMKGGALGFVRRGRLTPEIDRAVFSLSPGQISEVTGTARGYFVLKVDEFKEPVVQPFETVKDFVRAKVLLDLKNKRVNEFRAKAMKEAGVEIYLEAPAGGKPRGKH